MENKLSYQDQCLSVLIEQELKRANNKFPLFSTEHEAYAVLLEEVEEAEEEITKLRKIDIMSMNCTMNTLWGAIRKNNHSDYQRHVEEIKETTIKAIQELIQVAAMCDKWEMSLGGKDNE